MRRTSAADLVDALQRDPTEDRLLREEAATDFLKVHHQLQEWVLRELGLTVVWFERYEDMPDAIALVRAPGPRRRRPPTAG